MKKQTSDIFKPFYRFTSLAVLRTMDGKTRLFDGVPGLQDGGSHDKSSWITGERLTGLPGSGSQDCRGAAHRIVRERLTGLPGSGSQDRQGAAHRIAGDCRGAAHRIAGERLTGLPGLPDSGSQDRL